MLVMLIEFLAIHSSAMLGGAIGDRNSRWRQPHIMVGLSMLYAVFVATFAWVFAVWWPVLWFVWLVGNKIGLSWLGVGVNHDRNAYAYGIVVLSMLLYLGGVFFTIFAPLPRLGLSPETIGQLGPAMSGIWIESPHRLLGFGALYFAGLAVGRGWQTWWQRPLFKSNG